MTDGTTGRRMKLGVMPSLSERSFDGGTPRYADIQAMAQTAERIGLDSFWLPDHLIYRSPERGVSGRWEVFTFMSAVAAVTSRITIGPLVACTSFRNPALLAKMADALDEISNGRFILGLGCGWHEPEYTMFGYPFDHRVGRFEEAMAIIAPLLREGRVDFHGKYYDATETVLRPRGPSPTGPKLWIGANAPRMLALTAQYADAWNTVWHIDPAVVLERYAPLKAACAAVGRDPSTLELTAGTFVSLPEPGTAHEDDGKSITGTPEQVAERLQAFADIGVTHLIVILRPPTTPAAIERFARVVEILDRG